MKMGDVHSIISFDYNRQPGNLALPIPDSMDPDSQLIKT